MALRFCLIAVLLAICMSLGGTLRRCGGSVSESALDAMAGAVRAAFRPGDRVLAVPSYVVGTRQRLGDLPLITEDFLAMLSDPAIVRVHLVEEPVIGASMDTGVLDEFGFSPQPGKEWDGIRWTLWERKGSPIAPRPPLFELWRDLDQVRVSVGNSGGQDYLCDDYYRGRWRCPTDPGWHYVGRGVHEVSGGLRECVWVHPPLPGRVLRIAVPSIPGATEVVGAMGLTRHGLGRARAPVQVRLMQGDTLLDGFDYSAADGWRRFGVALAVGVEPLRIELSTSHNHGSHLCMRLQLLGAPP